MWPRHERRSALARAIAERGAYVLPVRLDDTDLEGLRPTVGYIDARRLGIENLVNAFVHKLSGGASAADTAIERTPRTPQEMQWVVDARPPGWEYLYFAGALLHERELLASKFRDHQMRYASGERSYVSDEEIPAYISRAANVATAISGSLGRVMSEEAQERAFGAPGEPGNAEEIRHLARRWTSVYERFLDWAADIRSTIVSNEYRRLLELLALFVEGPISQYREFVDDFVASVDRLPEHLSHGTPDEPLRIEMTLVLNIPDDVLADYEAEFDRLF
jgi:hypothetical protein